MPGIGENHVMIFEDLDLAFTVKVLITTCLDAEVQVI